MNTPRALYLAAFFEKLVEECPDAEMYVAVSQFTGLRIEASCVKPTVVGSRRFKMANEIPGDVFTHSTSPTAVGYNDGMIAGRKLAASRAGEGEL